MIVRLWRGWVSVGQLTDYVEYVTKTGLSSYRETPGNLGAELWTREVGDGRCEVTTVSWWRSLADIRAFAGDDLDRAVFYPEDDAFLLDREDTVTHVEVARTARP